MVDQGVFWHNKQDDPAARLQQTAGESSNAAELQ
jgi:hypothetical protein